MMLLIEGGEVVGRFPDDSDEPYRIATDGAVIIDDGESVLVDWKRDLATAAIELSDTSLSCERAAILAIPGTAETIEAMLRLCNEINASLSSADRHDSLTHR
jgi:hypothetical protein